LPILWLASIPPSPLKDFSFVVTEYCMGNAGFSQFILVQIVAELCKKWAILLL
jgi:hypothetical protein